MNRPSSVYIVSHTHWDREWYQTYHRFRVNLVEAVAEAPVVEATPAPEFDVTDSARELAEDETALPLGILYHNPDAPRYDLMSAVGLEMTAEQRLAGLNEALDHFAI